MILPPFSGIMRDVIVETHNMRLISRQCRRGWFSWDVEETHIMRLYCHVMPYHRKSFYKETARRCRDA